MTIQSANITPRERTKAGACAAGLGTVGMLAYHLPVTRGRYVNAAFNVVKNEALENIDNLNQSALSLTKRGKVKPEQKLFLSQMGVGEDLISINSKIDALKHSIEDSVTIKDMKQTFSDTFEACKKDVVLQDSVSMKAFSKVRWANFAWGTGIGMLLGYVLGLLKSKNSQVSYFD